MRSISVGAAALPSTRPRWAFERALMAFLDHAWTEPDEGIWEVRGPRRHFVHSKVMAWVAFDRAVKAVERFGLDGPVDEWRQSRTAVHEQICREGFNVARNTFTQHYGSTETDASLLMFAAGRFHRRERPADAGHGGGHRTGFARRRIRSRAIAPQRSVDGLPQGEGAFIACTFWLADNYSLQGRHDEAVRLFERLLSLLQRRRPPG